jgi:hypothetical protein
MEGNVFQMNCINSVILRVVDSLNGELLLIRKDDFVHLRRSETELKVSGSLQSFFTSGAREELGFTELVGLHTKVISQGSRDGALRNSIITGHRTLRALGVTSNFLGHIAKELLGACSAWPA